MNKVKAFLREFFAKRYFSRMNDKYLKKKGCHPGYRERRLLLAFANAKAKTWFMAIN